MGLWVMSLEPPIRSLSTMPQKCISNGHLQLVVFRGFCLLFYSIFWNLNHLRRIPKQLYNIYYMFRILYLFFLISSYCDKTAEGRRADCDSGSCPSWQAGLLRPWASPSGSGGHVLLFIQLMEWPCLHPGLNLGDSKFHQIVNLF